MNVDTFKGLLASQTTQKGFNWQEEESQGASVISCRGGFPYYDDDCLIRISVNENTMEVLFILDAIVPTYDNLKLVNDFNDQVQFLKAHIHKTQRSYLLIISSGLIVNSTEQHAVDTFVELFKYVASQDVAIFLRPLTVITQ